MNDKRICLTDYKKMRGSKVGTRWHEPTNLKRFCCIDILDDEPSKFQILVYLLIAHIQILIIFRVLVERLLEVFPFLTTIWWSWVRTISNLESKCKFWFKELFKKSALLKTAMYNKWGNLISLSRLYTFTMSVSGEGKSFVCCPCEL